MTDQPAADKLDGQEEPMLDVLLAKVYPLARAGDVESIDRVLKILTLKRHYRGDRERRNEEWKL